MLLILLIMITTRKRRQSYRHAGPRWQQQHTAAATRVTSNRATVTVFVTRDLDLDLLTSGSMHAERLL